MITVFSMSGQVKGDLLTPISIRALSEAFWQYQVLVKSLGMQQTRNMNENACFVSWNPMVRMLTYGLTQERTPNTPQLLAQSSPPTCRNKSYTKKGSPNRTQFSFRYDADRFQGLSSCRHRGKTIHCQPGMGHCGFDGPLQRSRRSPLSNRLIGLNLFLTCQKIPKIPLKGLGC